MGHLANGDLSMEGSGKKRFLDNGLNVPPLKFKKRRISAIRDFPPGCGRNAAPVNAKLEVDGEKSKEGVDDLGVESHSVAEKLKEEVKDVGLLESNSVREQESLAEVKTSDVGVSSKESESARRDTTPPLEDLAQVEEVADTLEPMAVDTLLPQLPVDTVQAEESNQNETSSPVNDAVESTEKKFPPRRKTSAIRDFTQDVAVKPTNTLQPMEVDAVEPVVDNQPSSAVGDNVAVESMVRKFPLRRKTSAIRDFPPGCGRGAATVESKEVRKSAEQGDKADAKRLENRVQPALDGKLKEKKDVVAGVQVKPVPPVKKQIGEQVYAMDKVKQVQIEKASIKPSAKIDKGSRNSGVKLGTESARLGKDASSKKNFAGKSRDKPDPISLDAYDDREVVQCLMAKPNCPWGPGKKTLKPASVVQSPEERGKKIFKSPSSIQPEAHQGKKASKPTSDNQSTTVENAGLESLGDREIVQSLMAAPNCPWRHGKKPFKSPGGHAKKFVARNLNLPSSK